MNVLKHPGLRTKIALPFAITAFTLIIVGAFSVLTAQNLVSDTDGISKSLESYATEPEKQTGRFRV